MIIINQKDKPMPLKYHFVCNKCDCEWLAQEDEVTIHFMDSTNKEYYTLVPVEFPVMDCPNCKKTTYGHTVALIMKI